jgi:hypothetical protein
MVDSNKLSTIHYPHIDKLLSILDRLVPISK